MIYGLGYCASHCSLFVASVGWETHGHRKMLFLQLCAASVSDYNIVRLFSAKYKCGSHSGNLIFTAGSQAFVAIKGAIVLAIDMSCGLSMGL